MRHSERHCYGMLWDIARDRVYSGFIDGGVVIVSDTLKIGVSRIMPAEHGLTHPFSIFQIEFNTALKQIMADDAYNPSKPMKITISQDTGHKK